MFNLLFFQINIDTAKQFHRLCNAFKVNRYIVNNIKIKILIHHGHHFFRTTCTERRICLIVYIFAIRITSNPKIRITVYRNQFYLFGIVIDTRNDHRITVDITIQFSFSAVKSNQCNTCITFHNLIFFHTLINIHIFKIQVFVIHISEFRIYKQSAHQNDQNDNFQRKHYSAHRTFPASASDSFLSVRQVFLFRHVFTPYSFVFLSCGPSS